MIYLHPFDVIYYFAAAQSLLEGVSPYNYGEFLDVVSRVYPGAAPYPCNYPPPAFFWFIPLTFFDLKVAAVVWRTLLLISYFGGCWALYCVMRTEGLLGNSFSKNKTLLLYLAPTLIIFPLEDWYYANCSSLTFLFYCLLLRGIYFNKSPFYLGVLLSCLVIKPHFFIPLGVCLALQFILSNKVSFFLGLLLGILLQITPSIYLVPNLLETYIQALPLITSASSQFGGISLYSAMHPDIDLANPVKILLILLFVPGVLLALNKSSTFKKALYIMPISLTLAPHANIHAILLLAPMYWYLLTSYLNTKSKVPCWGHYLFVIVLIGTQNVYGTVVFGSPLCEKAGAVAIFVLAIISVIKLWGPQSGRTVMS